MPPDKIKYFFYHWGPFLLHMIVTPEECKSVLKEGQLDRKKRSNKRNKYLAGHIKEEYSIKHPQRINQWLSRYVEVYCTALNKWRGGGTLKPEYKLLSLWINYMKAGEFNPPHEHGGDLSFVLYPYVPPALIKECKAFEGTMRGPGGVGWFYGKASHLGIDVVHHMPQSGDLFIFPADLQHWVYPFKSKIERPSLSGNILFNQDSRINYFNKEK